MARDPNEALTRPIASYVWEAVRTTLLAIAVIALNQFYVVETFPTWARIGSAAIATCCVSTWFCLLMIVYYRKKLERLKRHAEDP